MSNYTHFSMTIKDAIVRISRNEFLLPAFQREYVWNAVQVENLFDSLMKGYPISSMLFWKVRKEDRTSYRFYKILDHYTEYHHVHNDIFNTNQINEFYCILDGQQRLTSLYLGLCGSYAYHKHRARWENSENNFPTRHLYLNLTSKIDSEDSDKTYNFLFLDKKVTEEQRIYVDSKNDKWFKVGDIFYINYDNMLDMAMVGDITRDELKNLQELYRTINEKKCINYFEIDSETDSEIDSSSADVAVNIFVRINSGGTKLSISDMLLSMCVAGWQKKDARTEIHNLVDAVNNKGFNITHDFVLKTFLYLFRNDVRFRIKSFDNTFVTRIETEWDNIRDAILVLFDLMRTYGLTRSSLTSYNATLPILYYLYHRGIYRDFCSSIGYLEEREKIRGWLMRTLIMRSFTSHADGTLTKTHRAFSANVEECPIDSSVDSFPEDRIVASIQQATTLTDEAIDNILATQKDNSFAFAIVSLLYPYMDYKNGNFHLDHIHPFALCSERGLEMPVYNSVLNLQMLDGNENMAKNAKPLKQWIDEQTTNDTRGQFLKSHIIPDVDLDLSNFDEFIATRRKMLHQAIRSAFNISTTSASDLAQTEEYEDTMEIWDE